MKTIFLCLLILSGTAQAQTSNSQASQVITLRLQPISLIDFSAVTAGRPAKQLNEKTDAAAGASTREIIVNKNLSVDAALPVAAASTVQNEEKNGYRNMMAYNNNRMQPVYTFSSR